MGSEPGCDDHVQELLGAYLLGGLGAAEADEVRAHLDRCPACRVEHDDLALVPAWLSMLPAAGCPAGLTLARDAGDDRETGDREGQDGDPPRPPG